MQASLALSGKRATIQSQIPESGLADAVLNVIRRSAALGFRVSQVPIRRRIWCPSEKPDESGAHSTPPPVYGATRCASTMLALRVSGSCRSRCRHSIHRQRSDPRQRQRSADRGSQRPSGSQPALLEDAIAAAASAVAAYGALYASGRLLYEGDVCDLADAHAACHPGREPAG